MVVEPIDTGMLFLSWRDEMSGVGWPTDGLEAVKNCPVCGGEERSLLHTGLTDRVFGVAPGEWTLYSCHGCDAAWLDPRPNINTIHLAYASYYTHSDVDHPIVRRLGRLRSFIHDCMNDYRNSRFGADRQPSIRGGRWLIRLIPSLKCAIDAEFRHLKPLPAAGGRLLDVGFGNGGFLKLAQDIGWEVDGVDLDETAVETAKSRGFVVSNGDIFSLKSPSEQYDVVTLCHVIEHVHDPFAVISEAFRILKPGGVLWIDTPNMRSLGQKKFGEHWRGLEPPRHLILFTPRSLRNLLRQSGFEEARQYWRGLSVFDVFPVSEALASSRDPSSSSRGGKPPVREIFAELYEMVVANEREFLTITAQKPVIPC